jgi:hypothetical protein
MARAAIDQDDLRYFEALTCAHGFRQAAPVIRLLFYFIERTEFVGGSARRASGYFWPINQEEDRDCAGVNQNDSTDSVRALRFDFKINL